MKWIVEHASMMINRGQVGKDGKTPYRRVVGKESNQGIVEIGEQVMIKPKRSKKTHRTQSLASRWRSGTYMGMTVNSNEHIVALPDGGAAIRSRTVKRKT